jgi:hypothetical protein
MAASFFSCSFRRDRATNSFFRSPELGRAWSNDSDTSILHDARRIGKRFSRRPRFVANAGHMIRPKRLVARLSLPGNRWWRIGDEVQYNAVANDLHHPTSA